MDSSSSSRQRNLEEDALGGIGHQSKRIKFSQSPKFYDVFINHRGPDVKETLALPLYNSLENVGIRAFLDREEMELGDFFPSTIHNAIFSASVQIAIFSKRYAESAWCLEEIALMLQTQSKIIPVFYDVAPTDLRYLEKGVYAYSFTQYKEKGRYLNKLDNWKETLRSVSYITGYEFSHHNRNVDELCKKVVSSVLREVEKTRPLDIAKHPVGINDLVNDFESHCEMGSENKIIGVYGMGGSGKTTLAKELFNRKRSDYNASCFLFDVREASANGNLTSLQSKILKDLGHEDRTFHSILEGSSYLRSRLGRGPIVSFLIFIDDIDHIDQLDALLVRDIVHNSFPHLIVVTTRDEGVLIRAGITHRYKMKEMNAGHSTELFCFHAFHQSYATSGYEDLVEKFVKECGGLPLSLQVLGGHVFGRAKHYWKLELDKVRKTLPHDIKQRLRISIDALDTEQKQIFMDIACFFINKSKHMALRIWEGSGWSAEHALETLKDKCLVEILVGRTYWNGFDSGNIPLLRMHDHLRDLGREIADEVSTSPPRLWRPQYLRSLEANGFENILAGTCGCSFRCLNSIFDQYTKFELRYFLGSSNDCDDKTTTLLWLELDLSLLEKLDELQNLQGEDMRRLPSSCMIPSWIPLQNLEYLKISNGCLQRLWQSYEQAPFHLKELVLDRTTLEESPNSLEMLSHLEDLVLTGRAEWNGSEWNSPMQIDGRCFSQSLTKLTNLRSLILRDLTLSGELSLNMRKVPITIGSRMASLEKIDIRDVKYVSKVSIGGEYLHSLKSLHLESMENLTEVELEVIPLQNCVESKDIILNTEGPSEVEELPSPARPCCIERITIDGCWKLQKITGIEKLEGLKYLYLSGDTPVILKCIKVWQRLPSQVTTVIWSVSPRAEQFLNRDFIERLLNRHFVEPITRQYFSRKAIPVLASNLNFLERICKRRIFRGCTVTEIPSDCRERIEVPLSMLPGAIIILMLFESFNEEKYCRKNLKIPCMDCMTSYIPKGEWMVAVVVTEQEKIKKMVDDMSAWIPWVSEGRVKKGFILSIQGGREQRTLNILNDLIPYRW